MRYVVAGTKMDADPISIGHAVDTAEQALRWVIELQAEDRVVHVMDATGAEVSLDELKARIAAGDVS